MSAATTFVYVSSDKLYQSEFSGAMLFPESLGQPAFSGLQLCFERWVYGMPPIVRNYTCKVGVSSGTGAWNFENTRLVRRSRLDSTKAEVDVQIYCEVTTELTTLVFACPTGRSILGSLLQAVLRSMYTLCIFACFDPLPRVTTGQASSPLAHVSWIRLTGKRGSRSNCSDLFWPCDRLYSIIMTSLGCLINSRLKVLYVLWA